jgi:hypothetical protein
MKRLFNLIVALALVASLGAAHAQSTQAQVYSYLSTASNNSTLIYGAGPARVKWILPVNTNAATIYYLKLYNKATAPVCGTDTPYMRIPLPQNNNGGGALPIGLDDAAFPLGVGFCLTGGLADNDNTNAATGVVLNFGIAWQ